MYRTRERIWKGDIKVTDVEESEQMDASEIHARRLNAKEVLTPMKGENLRFPVEDGTGKISGEDQDLRTIHLNPGQPRQRTRTRFFEENQTGLFQTHVKTHRCLMVKPKMILVFVSGDFSCRHHVEP